MNQESSVGNKQIVLDSVISAAKDKSRVSGLTHNFYRYPARFSPRFARSVITAFTDPGDWILDPFVGGGTTLVEAMANGRNSLGFDISSLAVFVCTTKTQLLSQNEIKSFERWIKVVEGAINMHKPSKRFDEYARTGYYKNIEGMRFWRLRKAIEQALVTAQRIRFEAVRNLARCAILRAAQWALDSRRNRTSIAEFRRKLVVLAEDMGRGVQELGDRCEKNFPIGVRPRSISIHQSAVRSHDDPNVRNSPTPKLILTSPPYPGIHVLYHRWQVDGRRESPAPFWISNTTDGSGSSYYTLGDRTHKKLHSYFEQLERSFSSVAATAGPETTIVQMVAFAEPEWQLPRYLNVLSKCGLEEDLPWNLQSHDGRLWREVPNRKWHAHQKGSTPSAREVVLVHRKKLH